VRQDQARIAERQHQRSAAQAGGRLPQAEHRQRDAGESRELSQVAALVVVVEVVGRGHEQDRADQRPRRRRGGAQPGVHRAAGGGEEDQAGELELHRRGDQAAGRPGNQRRHPERQRRIEVKGRAAEAAERRRHPARIHVAGQEQARELARPLEVVAERVAGRADRKVGRPDDDGRGEDQGDGRQARQGEAARDWLRFEAGGSRERQGHASEPAG
jgi:hypothetical protein